jgi:hypothetical protein
MSKDSLYLGHWREWKGEDSSFIPIYGSYGVENYIVVLIEVVNENCE